MKPYTKIANCIKSKISKAVHIKPIFDCFRYCTRKRVTFYTFRASSHCGKVAQIVKHARESSGLIQKHWSPIEFKELADTFDKGIGDNAVIVVWWQWW